MAADVDGGKQACSGHQFARGEADGEPPSELVGSQALPLYT